MKEKKKLHKKYSKDKSKNKYKSKKNDIMKKKLMDLKESLDYKKSDDYEKKLMIKNVKLGRHPNYVDISELFGDSSLVKKQKKIK